MGTHLFVCQILYVAQNEGLAIAVWQFHQASLNTFSHLRAGCGIVGKLWVADPQAVERLDDGFGQQNSLMRIVADDFL